MTASSTLGRWHENQNQFHPPGRYVDDAGATSGDVRDQPKVADAASELLQDVFGKDKSPCRLVYGVASLPLGTPVELEIIFEVAE
jgi:enamine deaminase RidA (YjgF/YER057c/UK114 family)